MRRYYQSILFFPPQVNNSVRTEGFIRYVTYLMAWEMPYTQGVVSGSLG